ncbi:MAG: N-acetylneuraminate synthase family protein [Alphaproteobacteria bacterium]
MQNRSVNAAMNAVNLNSCPPLFIAEISSNHLKAGDKAFDLDRALATIDQAANIGANAVKFQLFKIDQLFAPEILAASPQHRARAAWELPLDAIPKLAQHSKAQGLQFACTPFDLEAAAYIAPHVDFFKIASYELLWHELLLACLSYQKPVILSTGMATLDEIEAAIAAAKQHQASSPTLELMHCVSSYPTPLEDCNLAAISTLRAQTGLNVGWSDHSKHPAALLAACLRYGASSVEFHLDLDGTGAEYAPGHCWLPAEIKPLIQLIHNAHKAAGDGIKRPALSEQADCAWRADPDDGLRPLKAKRAEFIHKSA